MACRKAQNLLRQYGSTKWIPPIMEIKQLDSKLSKRSDKTQFVKTITDEMANAGKIGFCPTQYLRKIIIPQFMKNQDDLGKFSKNISMFAECFKYIKERLGEKGDGSASNLFTLKYLIRPMADPKSNLFNDRYYEKTGLKAEDILYSIADKWAEIFSQEKGYARDLIRSIVDVFIKEIVKLETPKSIYTEISKILEYTKNLSVIIDSQKQYRRLYKPFHSRGINKLMERLENKGGQGGIFGVRSYKPGL